MKFGLYVEYLGFNLYPTGLEMCLLRCRLNAVATELSLHLKSYNSTHKNRYLNTSHYGQQVENKSVPIYVVEYLLPESKELHALARKTAKRLSYKHIWVKHSRIYMRNTYLVNV